RTVARRLAAIGGHRRIVRARAAAHAGGVGRPYRLHRAVPDRFAGATAAMATRSRAVRPPSPGRQGLHRGAAAVADRHRCGADRRGSHGFSTTGSAIVNTGVRATASTVLGLAVYCLLLFLPAGTLNYWQGWVFIATAMVATIVPTIY